MCLIQEDTQSYFDQNYKDIYDKYLSGNYDGIIIHNSDKSADDAILAIVDNVGQVKSATYSADLSGFTDNIGTFDGADKDIRFSERDPDSFAARQEVQKQLIKENAILKEDNILLKELVALQGKVTNGTILKKSSVDVVSKKIMKQLLALFLEQFFVQFLVLMLFFQHPHHQSK